MKIVQFHHGKWHYELIESLGCYRSLRAFCTNDEAILTHLSTSGRPRRATFEGTLIGVADHEIPRFIEPVTESINIALAAYSRQLVVVIVSITEAALVEALEVLFSFRPNSIKSLENDNQNAGFRATVSLDELAAATDLTSLRALVVDRAVSIASQGKSTTAILRRFERLFGQALDDHCKQQYIELVDLRNEIVHDNTHCELSDERVKECFDIGIDLVERLGMAVSSLKLPIDDPMHLFNG